MWTEVLQVIAVAAGVFFMFTASLGVLRLGDFYTRIHAPTKAATLGLVFLLAALAFESPTLETVTKGALALLFIGMTAPLGAHILARAAYRRGVQPPVEVDEYAPLVRERKERRR